MCLAVVRTFYRHQLILTSQNPTEEGPNIVPFYGRENWALRTSPKYQTDFIVSSTHQASLTHNLYHPLIQAPKEKEN